ncbi:DNA-protecting protein DprA [Candidatus Peregrinibacteria bacterium]|nr:DNA-protecting protein DprA [Candidatus Peregrinibacteria bacterium]MBI3816346.1 DNA-protecting protein DprA [Candidatus Peregrinibacteria bacterium]
MSHADFLWSYLNVLTRERYEALVQVYGSLEDARRHVGEEMLKGLGCRQEMVEKTLLRLEDFDEERYAAELQKRGIDLLSLADGRYPKSLREIGDPPVFLSVHGDLSILDQPCVALVGTRSMSPYGRRVVETFVPPLVHAGIVTVSGLAHGIDAAVAAETIKARGKTVAVLGHGLGTIYPRTNEKLAQQIHESGGLLLSEFSLDFPPDTYTFPARNRIIAGLSLATVVLEAPRDSGALITADLALQYNRDVFAVPGQIFDAHFQGCHDLIARGHAKLVTDPADVLQEIGIVVPESRAASSYVPQSDDEEVLLGVLTTMPQRIDELVERSGIPASRINAALTLLELAGVVKNVGGGMWVRG